jgi:hypothetical protein
MTSSIWQSLFGNVALIAILVVAWDFMSDWTQRLPRRVENTLMGLIMGAGAVASMEMAEPILGGLFFDLRGPLVGASAFFGGLPAVAASATLSIAYRIYLGGPGAYAGVVSLLLASAIGLTCHWGVRGRTRTFMDIATFGLACSAGTLLAFLTLPWATFLDVISRAGIPLFTLSTLSALMIGLLLYRHGA